MMKILEDLGLDELKDSFIKEKVCLINGVGGGGEG